MQLNVQANVFRHGNRDILSRQWIFRRVPYSVTRTEARFSPRTNISYFQIFFLSARAGELFRILLRPLYVFHSISPWLSATSVNFAYTQFGSAIFLTVPLQIFRIRA